MFQPLRLNRSYAEPRCLSTRAQLVWLALVLVLLSADVMPGLSSRSKSDTPTMVVKTRLSQATTGHPEVTMDTTRRDFGDVFAGEEIEHSFVVRNTGTKPLELAE